MSLERNSRPPIPIVAAWVVLVLGFVAVCWLGWDMTRRARALVTERMVQVTAGTAQECAVEEER